MGLVETSTENIAVGTPLSDVVTEVPVAVGQTVRTGDPLFKLDDRHLRAEIAVLFPDNDSQKDREWPGGGLRTGAGVAAPGPSARAGRAGPDAGAAVLADVTRQRNFAEGLPDKSAISSEELTRRRSAVETAQARLEQAQAQVAAAAAQTKLINSDRTEHGACLHRRTSSASESASRRIRARGTHLDATRSVGQIEAARGAGIPRI